MGKTTFVKSRDGFRAQEKVIVPAGRFQNAPSFARGRENASEFCNHYQFISAGVEINFEQQSSKVDFHLSAYLPVGLTATTRAFIV